MSYESPITVMFHNVGSTIDDYVITQVEEVGVVVDKEELIKALNYDRDQYSKGLEEGLRAASTDELLDELKRRLDEDGTAGYRVDNREEAAQEWNKRYDAKGE